MACTDDFLFGPAVALEVAPFPVFWRFTSVSRIGMILGFVGCDLSNRLKSARTVAFNCMNCSACLKSLRLSWHSLNPALHLLSPRVWLLLWGACPATEVVAQKLRRSHARASLFIGSSFCPPRRDGVIRSLTGSRLAARRTLVIPWSNSRVRPLPLTRLVGIAHPSQWGRTTGWDRSKLGLVRHRD